MSRARLDMVAYTHSYHMMSGCARDSLPDTSLWKNQSVRDLLKQKRFDKHRWQHTSSCWKKDAFAGLVRFLGNQMKYDQ